MIWIALVRRSAILFSLLAVTMFVVVGHAQPPLSDAAKQAQARVDGTINRGKEFAHAALEMAQFKKKWKTKNQ